MPNVKNIEKITSLFPSVVGSCADIERAVAKRFTTRIWGSQLIAKESWEGLLADGVRKVFRADAADARIKPICRAAFEGSQPETMDLPDAIKRKFYQVKYSYAPPENSTPLDKLQELLRSVEPAPVPASAEIHWSENPTVLKSLSLLQTVTGAPIEASVLQTLFNGSAGSLEQILRYLQKEGMFDEALQLEKKLREIVSKGSQVALRGTLREEMLELAKETAAGVAKLQRGQSRLVLGGTLGRSPALNIQIGGEYASYVQDFLLKDPSALVAKLSGQIEEHLVQVRPFSDPLQSQLKELLQKGIVEALLPSLSQSLLVDRSLGAKILLAPVDLLRMGAKKGATSVCDWLTQSLAEKFTEKLGEEGLRELHRAALAGTLEKVLKAKVESKLFDALRVVRTTFCNGFQQLAQMLPSYVATFIQASGYGDLGEPEQPVWFSIQKEADETYTLSVFAGGSAAYLQPSIVREGAAAHQVLVQYRDLTAASLDSEFFNTLFSYRVWPQLEPTQGSYTLNELHHGLLQSLGKEPADLSSVPQAYSAQVTQYNGHWGALYALLHYQEGRKTRQAEEDYLFNLQAKALFDAAKHSSAASMGPLLRSSAELFLESAMLRFKKGEFSLDEMKQLYATVWEIHQIVPIPIESSGKSARKKQVVVPAELASHLRTLLSAVPFEMFAMVKDLLIGMTGSDIEVAIDSIASEFPHLVRPAPALLEKVREMAHVTFAISFGIAVSDLSQPTFWSCVRVALLTARVALALFSSSFGLMFNAVGIASMVGLYALRESAFYFFPETIRSIARLKWRLCGGLLSQAFLGKEHVESFNALVRSWHAVTTRSGTISYVTGQPLAPLVQKCKAMFPPVPLVARRLGVEGERKPAPLMTPHPEAITEANAKSAIQQWLAEIRGISPSIASQYLNEKMKSLPVPSRDANDCWSAVENVPEMLEEVARLAVALYNSIENNQNMTEERRTKTRIHLFKAYAIIDKLAHRCPEARLEGFTANGWALEEWHKEALFRLNDAAMRVQLQALQKYFGVDGERTPKESHKVMVRESDTCLFLPDFANDDDGVDFGRGRLKSFSTERYLRQFLDDPAVQARLAAHRVGVAPDAPYIDKIAYLYANPKKGGAVAERERVLPRPFHLLGLANQLANSVMKDPLLGLRRIESVDDDIVTVITLDNRVREILEWVTGGMLFKEKEPSRLDAIPRARYAQLVAEGSESAWQFLWDRHRFWGKEASAIGLNHETIGNLSEIASNFLQMAPREQNEILNEGRLFRNRVNRPLGEIATLIGSQMKRFVSPLVRLLGPRASPPNNAIAKMPAAEKQLFEMMKSDEKPLVRTLEYFSEKSDSLSQQDFRLLFRVFILQGNLIYPYLQKHPGFAKDLGGFFQRVIGLYSAAGEWGVALSLIEIAILAEAEARAAHPGCEVHFPKLRDLLLDIRQRTKFYPEWRDRATQLLALRWHFIDPTPEMAKEVAFDLALNLKLSNRQNAQPELQKICEDVSVKWEAALRQAVGSDVLNAAATDFGWVKGTELQWEGSFPFYRSGGFEIHFDRCAISDEEIVHNTIRGYLRQIFQEPIPDIEALEEGYYPIQGHPMGVELRQQEGEKFHRLAFFIFYGGERHYWTEGERGAGLTHWIGKVKGDGMATLLYLDKKGEVKQTQRVRKGEEIDQIALLPPQVFVSGEACEAIDLTAESHGLGLLTWFQPLSEIRAYRSSANPTEVRRIEFPTLQMSFNVSNGRAVGEGAFSGLAICAAQRQEERYPVLNHHSRYLLLENSSGEPKVVLPSNTLGAALMGWILKQTTGIQTSQLLDKWVGPLLEEKGKCYLYDIDPQGHLVSTDPDAMLHLLCHHLANKSFSDVRRDLLIIENLGKRKGFSESFLQLSLYLQLASLAMNHPETTRVMLRLGAIGEENRLIQTREKVVAGPAGLLSWIALQGNYYQYLKRIDRGSAFALDEHQELFLLEAIVERAKEFVGISDKQGTIFRELTKAIGLDALVETALLHPKVAERYSFFKQKYAVEGEQGGVNYRTVLRSLLLGQSNLLSPLPQSSRSSPLMGIIAERIAGKIDFDKLTSANDLLHADLNASWEEVPLTPSSMTPGLWLQYMPQYYQIALGKSPSPEKAALFTAKRKELIRMLSLLKGVKYGPKIDRWINILRMVLSAGNAGWFPSYEGMCFVVKSVQDLPSLDQEKLEAVKERTEFFPRQLRFACNAANLFSFISPVKTLRSLAKQYAPQTVGLGLLNYAASKMNVALVPQISTAVGVYHGVNAYMEESERLQRAQAERATLEAASPDDGLLPEALQVQMGNEDADLGDVASALLKSHFFLSREPDEPHHEVERFEVANQDAMMEKYFGRLNQSLTDFYDRPVMFQKTYRPKDVDHFFRLGANLQGAKESLNTLCESLKKELLSFSRVKRANEEMSAMIRHMHEDASAVEDEIYFKELMQAFGRGDRQWLKTYTAIGAEQKSAFEEKMYRYLIHATRLQQLDRAIQIWEGSKKGQFDDPQVKVLFRQLSFELTRKRVFDFQTVPERFLRSYLLFEYGTKTMLWEKQVQQVERMLRGADQKAVVQLITGSGKTFFGIPMIDYIGSDGTQSIYNVFPDSLAVGNIEQVSHTSGTVFGQTANAVEITRDKALGRKNLWALLRAHMRALYRGEHFNGRKKDLQALELRFIEAMYDFKSYPPHSAEDKKALFYYMKLLGHLRKRVRLNADEAHHLFRRNEELNHPMGDKKQVKESYVSVIAECASHIVDCKEIADLVRLQDPRPNKIDPKDYHARIKPLIAERMSRSKTFSIPEDDRALFVQYLCGKTKTIPPFVLKHAQEKEIRLAVGVLNQILPDALRRQIFVDYGPPKEDEYAVLYSGNNCPIENSKIKNPFEAHLKTCLLWLHMGLSKEQIRRFGRKLHKMAEAERRQKRLASKADTKVARTFKSWLGNAPFSLADFSHNPPPALLELLCNSSQVRLAYVKHCIASDITYFSKNQNSDSQNFASMFSSFYSDTATPSRDGAFPLGTNVLWDKGTTGDFVDFVCNTCNKPDSIVVLDSLNAKETLLELLSKQFRAGSKASAIIEAGALLEGLSNKEAADMTRAFIRENRPDLKADVFYDEKQELVIWEKRDNDAPRPFAESSIKPEERITYLDHIHTFGADVKQPLQAEGVVTLGESSTLEEFVQAGGRMRGLKTAGQRLVIAVTRALKERIAPVSFGNEPLTIRQIISFLQKNEAAVQGHENYLVALQKIANIIRRSILDAMIFAPDVSACLKIFEAFENLLIRDANEDPSLLYGWPEESMKTPEAIEQYKQAQFKIITSSNMFTKEKRDEIWTELEPIGQEPNMYLPEESVSLAPNPLIAHDLGIAQQVAQSQSQNQQMHQQQNQNLQQNTQTAVREEPPKTDVPRLRVEPAKWNGRLDYFADLELLQWSDFDTPAIDLNNHKTATIYSVADSLYRLHPDLADACRGRMFWSNNFLGIQEKSGEVCEPFSRKPILDLLLLQSRNPKTGQLEIFSVAIDQNDAKQWSKILEDDRERGKTVVRDVQIALFSLALQTVTDSGEENIRTADLFANPLFCQDLVRWKFLAGQSRFHMGHPEREGKLFDAGRAWLKNRNLEALEKTFLSIHKRYGLAPYTGSDMEALLSREID